MRIGRWCLWMLLIPAVGWGADWVVARDGQFEVYSQTGEAQARLALRWFEQLSSLVRKQTGFDAKGSKPVRVIGFRSEKDYEPYRASPMADAYYVGVGERDYIVMPSLGQGSFGTAAHEYAHLIQHAAGGRLPPWLSEGLAEVLSTVWFEKSGSYIGGLMVGRRNFLRHNPWMPLDQLMELPADSPLRDERSGTQIFYSESGALTEMLALSPAYRTRFGELLAELNRGTDGRAALTSTYGKPLETVRRDLASWVERPGKPVALGKVQLADRPFSVEQSSKAAVQLMMAGVLLATGDMPRAEAAYREVAQAKPETAEVWAGLGAIAAARAQYDEAGRLWKRALELGLKDAGLCVRYADLLERNGGNVEERREALRRAVAIRPDFDEARWILALLENNEGNYPEAVTQLRAMGEVPPARAFAYWTSMADSLTELGLRDEAQKAAARAEEHARDGAEKERARRLAFVARTRLAVRMTKDEAGNARMETTRVPDNDVEFNPFVEPADDARKVRGILTEIECGAAGLRITVETSAGSLHLTIPDPARVRMTNAPPEFTCGPQPGTAIVVQYAATKEKEGVVRGLEFP